MIQKPIFIIGYMASGKTTFGKALARALEAEFFDLDFYIEQRFRKTVTAIFADEGEEGFRSKEAAMLREVGQFENAVIACGGGTPCFRENLEFMLERGTVVWLEASPDCIVRRLLINNSRRPLMAGKSPDEIKAAVAEGLSQRLPFYSKAHISFCGEKLETRSEIDNSINEFIKLLPQ